MADSTRADDEATGIRETKLPEKSLHSLEAHIRRQQEDKEELQIRLEELRAANEELRTTNASLYDRLEAREMHDRQLAEDNERLQRQSYQLHQLTRAANIGILFVGNDLAIQRYTPLAAAIFRLQPDDRGRPVTDIVHTLAYNDLYADVRQVLAAGEAVHRNVRSQSGRPFALRIDPYLASSTEEGGAVVSITDRSDQQQAVERLEEVGDVFQLAQEGVELGLWKVDLEERKVFMDHQAAEIFGIGADGWTPLTKIFSLIHPDDKREVLGAFDSVARSDEPDEYEVEHRIIRLEGDLRWIQMRAQVTVDERNGKREAVGMIGVMRDITRRRQSREALQESERKFRQLAEQSLLGITLLQAGIFKYVNPRAAELVGRPAEEITGQLAIEEIVHLEDWPRVEEYLRACSSEERIRSESCRLERPAGEPAEVEILCSRITSEGRPALLCYLLDVSERRRLERNLLRVQEEERQELGRELHDSVASQLAGVAMIVGSYAEAIDDSSRSVTSDNLRHVKEVIREAGEQARQLSHGLQPGRLKGEGLSPALDELAAGLDLTFDGSCRFEGLSNLPSLDGAIATHLYRLAQEAATNAVKHAEAARIDIVLKTEDEALKLLIVDDGAGFNPDETEEGVGLQSMRYRARFMGASLEVTSSPDEGSTVQCSIPLSTLC